MDMSAHWFCDKCTFIENTSLLGTPAFLDRGFFEVL